MKGNDPMTTFCERLLEAIEAYGGTMYGFLLALQAIFNRCV